MPSASSEPVGEAAKPHIESIQKLLENRKPEGKTDLGNQEYLKDKDLIDCVLLLRQSLGVENWAWGLWRFSNKTLCTPITQAWLVPIKIVGGEPCVLTELNELITKLSLFEKTLIEGTVEIEGDLDLLFIVPETKRPTS